MINKHPTTHTSNNTRQHISNYTSKHTKKLFNNKKHSGGGGILSSVGNFIYTPDAGKNYTDHSILSTMSSKFKNLNISSKLKNGINYNTNSSIQIYYNYNTHNKNAKTILVNVHNKPIGSSLVQQEPHIKINNINRYLIVLIDINKVNKLKKILWCAVFAFSTKQKTILSYQAPSPSNNEKQHKYIIKAYTYPDNIPQYTVIYMGMPDRMSEYNNFIKYINTNTSQQTPQTTTQKKPQTTPQTTSQINIKQKIRQQLIAHDKNTQLSKTAKPNMKLIYKKIMYIYKDSYGTNIFNKIQVAKLSTKTKWN